MARTQGSHSDITGPRIRTEALRLFAQHGYAAVSMRQIASAVGVQAGALYNYTPDKQSLLFSLMEGHMTELLAAWHEQEAAYTAEASDPEAKVLARLEAFTRFHIRFHLERPDAVFIAYMELRNLSEDNFTAIESLRREYENALQAILKEGVRLGVLHVPDPKIATLAVIAMLNGVMTWYRSGGRLSLEEVEGIYWDMVKKSMQV
ncbi:MAG: TetR/AcrR family transcriptional regulator [Phaeobacter italicus]|jgi:AcrR family transcriptional regulator|uniref:HTH-type transcriptional repressor KstR2 n=1 Tax=Phaeobacter italicus TaxID=481446 RepID=A0A0H5DDT5_9RHOB|nr:TetR/AcrR family transcriptional regulator [Phaeobacter italicus]MEC8015134.1 TetR/AcrR family transcriptional regulator [Pseudomonadota bacterium]NKX70902.1 TetR/AcrR family transcriptional regulator [Rhodobacteraceae bacterium R_SAG1]MBO9442787.1 TetR family transcriptional regulator [Phaeobacter italicus]MBY5978393.1 TetR/AcrR family transcriptional regulator [Phaeobacter italicus]MBY6045755.1 TetR/AcrR family transcriptional regulator [Phaeobacter italicus]